MRPPLKKRGFCHVFGDDIPLDEGVMPFRFAIGRVTDPKELIPHLFAAIDAAFPQRVRHGDLILAGRNFACGKAHMQGFIAMEALGIGVLCGTMPYKAHRGAVGRGVPILTGCSGIGEFAATGDEIEVDFSTGEASNITRGTARRFPPIPEILGDIVARGGLKGSLAAWLAEHPEMRAPIAAQE